MPARTELDRLAAALPGILRQTEVMVDFAEEDLILQRILHTVADSAVSTDTRLRGDRHRAPRLRLVGVIAGAAAVVAFGVLAVTELGSGSTSTQQAPLSPSSPAFAVHGASGPKWVTRLNARTAASSLPVSRNHTESHFWGAEGTWPGRRAHCDLTAERRPREVKGFVFV